MKTFIANFVLPLLAWLTVCVIAGIPQGLPIELRISLPIPLIVLAWGFSRLHDTL